ncbi:MAG: XRE family transcriptional regulator [Longimicrobiaceae bacterium]
MEWYKWEDVRAKAAPETIESALREAEVLAAGIELNELRRARRLTQEQLAERLGIRQSNVSKMERRADLHVSTLRDMVEAMGGELRVTARFPDAEYELDYIGRANGAAA